MRKHSCTLFSFISLLLPHLLPQPPSDSLLSSKLVPLLLLCCMLFTILSFSPWKAFLTKRALQKFRYSLQKNRHSSKVCLKRSFINHSFHNFHRKTGAGSLRENFVQWLRQHKFFFFFFGSDKDIKIATTNLQIQSVTFKWSQKKNKREKEATNLDMNLPPSPKHT